MTAPNNLSFSGWTVSPQRTVTLAGNGSLPCVCSDGVSALAIANGIDTMSTTLPTAPT